MANISSWFTITKKSTSGGKGNTPGTKVALSTPVPSACTLNVHVSESEVQLCPPALMVNVIAHWSLRSKVSKPTKAKEVVGAGASVDGGNVPVAENAHVPAMLGWERADNLTEAVAMARNIMGNSAEITMLHQPMIGIADME